MPSSKHRFSGKANPVSKNKTGAIVKNKRKGDWFVTKSEEAKNLSSSDDTEDYTENISQQLDATDFEFAHRTRKERAHKILSGVETKKNARLDYSDLIEEFKDITENANEQTKNEINQRIRENVPKDVEPGTVEEFFYGCAIDQPEVKDRNCVPGCIRGYSLKGGCNIPVYEINDGELTKLVDLTGNKAYLYIGHDDKITSYDLNDLAKEIRDQHGEPLDELYVYEAKSGSSQYKHVTTVILRQKSKSYKRYKEGEGSDENLSNKLGGYQSQSDSTDTSKKTQKSYNTSKNEYSSGAIFGFFIFFLFVIVIIAIFWIMRTPSDSNKIQQDSNMNKSVSNNMTDHVSPLK